MIALFEMVSNIHFSKNLRNKTKMNVRYKQISYIMSLLQFFIYLFIYQKIIIVWIECIWPMLSIANKGYFIMKALAIFIFPTKKKKRKKKFHNEKLNWPIAQLLYDIFSFYKLIFCMCVCVPFESITMDDILEKKCRKESQKYCYFRYGSSKSALINGYNIYWREHKIFQQKNRKIYIFQFK